MYDICWPHTWCLPFCNNIELIQYCFNDWISDKLQVIYCGLLCGLRHSLQYFQNSEDWLNKRYTFSKLIMITWYVVALYYIFLFILISNSTLYLEYYNIWLNSWSRIVLSISSHIKTLYRMPIAYELINITIRLHASSVTVYYIITVTDFINSLYDLYYYNISYKIQILYCVYKLNITQR